MKYEITKGSEKDFEGAPDWATECVWNDKGSESFCYWLNPKTKTIFNPNWHSKPDCWNEEYGWRNYIKAERRQITEPVVNQQLTTEFDSDGLPPVGAMCRYRAFSDMPWVECEVLGWYGADVWLKRTDDGRTFVMGNPELFPIRSPEDVVRDEAIEAMRDVGYALPAAIRFTKEEMAALYDAGYRKVDSSSVDLKINITTDEMWREFEKKSDMEDVRKLITTKMYKWQSRF